MSHGPDDYLHRIFDELGVERRSDVAAILDQLTGWSCPWSCHIKSYVAPMIDRQTGKRTGQWLVSTLRTDSLGIQHREVRYVDRDPLANPRTGNRIPELRGRATLRHGEWV